MDTIAAQGQANRKEEKREDDDKKFREWITIILWGVTIYFLNRQVDEMQRTFDPIKVSADATVTLADASNKTVVAAQRAWLGAIDAAIVRSDNSTVIKGTVTYVNSGHEPARYQVIGAGPEERVYNRLDWNAGVFSNALLAKQEECKNTNTIVGFQSAWPTTGQSNYSLHFPSATIPQIGAAAWSDGINSGEDIVTVQGCFVYETVAKVRHTAFCLFYDARMTDVSHLSFCTVGNYAD
jgi:hypothetical protein